MWASRIEKDRKALAACAESGGGVVGGGSGSGSGSGRVGSVTPEEGGTL
jgi:hypothetical protein